MPQTFIREEQAADIEGISAVTRAAFETLEISNQTEPLIIMALREAGALTVSLVAEHDGELVGHIAFSPVALSDGGPEWYGLGPVSVRAGLHRQGIGTKLVNEGLARLKAQGAAGCCVVGHPEYYRRFGFVNADGLSMQGVPPEVFFVLPFAGPVPQGTVTFHEAFRAGTPGDDA